MNRKAFFDALRRRDSGVFGTSLSQGQVTGTEAILDACLRHGVTDPHHVANVLGQVLHETGGRMSPVRETFATSDAQAVSRLETAWKAGKLPWVKTPYWRPDAQGLSWYGRGPIQITHRANYAKMEAALGVPLTKNPNLALDPKIGADIAVVGMTRGMFTGRKLSDFAFPSALDNPVSSNPRRIINGQDGTDKKVAGYHRAFHAALVEAGYGAASKPAEPVPAPRQPDGAQREPVADGAGWAGLVILAVMAAIFAALAFLST